MRRLLAVLNMLGFTMVVFAATMAVPTAVAAWGGDDALDAFVDGLLVALAIGLVLWAGTRRGRCELRPRGWCCPRWPRFRC